MSTPSLQDLVQDWGGFERLVARLHATGTVSVEHNVVLPGRSGAPRQCDVVIRHREGLYEHLIVVECKKWRENVSRLHVDALATTVQDLNAAKGVIMTMKGFQSGAETMAAHAGIDLYRVRELSDAEWGPPGRVVDLVIQIVSRSVGSVKFENARLVEAAPGLGPVSLNIVFGDPEGRTATPLVKADGTEDGTLEELIGRASLDAVEKFTTPSFTINGGTRCTRYMRGTVNIAPKTHIRVRHRGAIIEIDRIELEVGLRIDQSRFTYDRAKNYMFALALENCITGSVTAASQKVGSTATALAPLSRGGDDDHEDVLVNGSVCKVIMDRWFRFQELDGLSPVPLRLRPSTGTGAPT